MNSKLTILAIFSYLIKELEAQLPCSAFLYNEKGCILSNTEACSFFL